jgi:hypothetical protein
MIPARLPEVHEKKGGLNALQDDVTRSIPSLKQANIKIKLLDRLTQKIKLTKKCE